MNARTREILRLYRAMPGAPPIPTEHGSEMVGDVIGNDHWNFCAAIDAAITAAVRPLYEEHP